MQTCTGFLPTADPEGTQLLALIHLSTVPSADQLSALNSSLPEQRADQEIETQQETAHTKIGLFWRQEFTARFVEVAAKPNVVGVSPRTKRFGDVIRRAREDQILRRHEPPCSERGARWRGDFGARYLEVQHRSDQPPERDRNECGRSTDQSFLWVLNQRDDDRELHQKVSQLASQALLNGGSKLAAAVFAGCRPTAADLLLFEQLAQLAKDAPAAWAYKHTSQYAFESLTDLKGPPCSTPQVKKSSKWSVVRAHFLVKTPRKWVPLAEPTQLAAEHGGISGSLGKRPIFGKREQPTTATTEEKVARENSHQSSLRINGLLPAEELLHFMNEDNKQQLETRLREIEQLKSMVSLEKYQDLQDKVLDVVVNQDDKKENDQEQSGLMEKNQSGSLGRKVACAPLQYKQCCD